MKWNSRKRVVTKRGDLRQRRRIIGIMTLSSSVQRVHPVHKVAEDVIGLSRYVLDSVWSQFRHRPIIFQYHHRRFWQIVPIIWIV